MRQSRVRPGTERLRPTVTGFDAPDSEAVTGEPSRFCRPWLGERYNQSSDTACSAKGDRGTPLIFFLLFRSAAPQTCLSLPNSTLDTQVLLVIAVLPVEDCCKKPLERR